MNEKELSDRYLALLKRRGVLSSTIIEFCDGNLHTDEQWYRIKVLSGINEALHSQSSDVFKKWDVLTSGD